MAAQCAAREGKKLLKESEVYFFEIVFMTELKTKLGHIIRLTMFLDY